MILQVPLWSRYLPPMRTYSVPVPSRGYFLNMITAFIRAKCRKRQVSISIKVFKIDLKIKTNRRDLNSKRKATVVPGDVVRLRRCQIYYFALFWARNPFSKLIHFMACPMILGYISR